jgi:hypothetical protein
MFDLFRIRKNEVYQDINEHYLEYILNYGSERSVVQVRKVNLHGIDTKYFSSKSILSRVFSDCEIIFKIKKKPHKIENLFTFPRLSKSYWFPIRSKNCYYHPHL